MYQRSQGIRNSSLAAYKTQRCRSNAHTISDHRTSNFSLISVPEVMELRERHLVRIEMGTNGV